MPDARFWDEVTEGEELTPIAFPLTVHRLVVEAGANRDFATVHHNKEAAQATGAPDCFANNVLIQGMLERIARDFIGIRGVIRKIGPFRMQSFLLPGTTAILSGSVERKWLSEEGWAMVELSIKCTAAQKVTAAGRVTAILPRRSETPLLGT